MHDFTKKIIHKYEIRKSDKQKKAFIDEVISYCEQLGYSYQIQETRREFLKSRNLIVGDVKNAKVLCTAHYDTCATMGFVPNFITPLNKLVYYSYQFLLSFCIIALAIALGHAIEAITDGVIFYSLGHTFFLFAMFYQLIGGYRNPKNYNDNTSGVVTLLELMDKVPLEDREKVAFVFFDNEEKGLIGSGAFRKYFPKFWDKLLVNFDCVGDGDTILMKYNHIMNESKDKTIFEASFITTGTKSMVFTDKGVYPSDQKHFDKICNTVAVAALKKSKIVGLYMDRIHTPKDTMLDEKNVEILVEGMINYIKEI